MDAHSFAMGQAWAKTVDGVHSAFEGARAAGEARRAQAERDAEYEELMTMVDGHLCARAGMVNVLKAIAQQHPELVRDAIRTHFQAGYINKARRMENTEDRLLRHYGSLETGAHRSTTKTEDQVWGREPI